MKRKRKERKAIKKKRKMEAKKINKRINLEVMWFSISEIY